MARPTKQGLEYFSFDTDFFSDVKIRKIARACGPASTSILICLLCNIYRDKGYYILWDEDLPFVVADTVGTTEGAVEEVIKKALQVGFFNQELHEKYKILTSNGIQCRFKSAVIRREEIEYVIEYLVSDIKNEVIAYKNGVNDDVSTQSKVKIKRKNSKPKETSTNVEAKKAEQAKKLAAAKAATLKRRNDFGQSLVPYMERYGKEMIRAFFDYWSELNKSETKMRFETNKTWEVAKRLATWANNEKFNGKSSSTIPKAGFGSSAKSAGNKAASRETVGQFARAVLEQYKSKDGD
ncbi:DUF4373 domain-containing protein [uncultured Parabacteroides sp.]|jgi:hypothetical protein|uniref:DUF4373 domain-containing protein n=1 Tax=uncultured Parabacteroides sp. TaxID=512312 RepID=UPI0025EA3B08|nr:DUF4373 domain-containing protein [uncultured Parabacteroides sp.]